MGVCGCLLFASELRIIFLIYFFFQTSAHEQEMSVYKVNRRAKGMAHTVQCLPSSFHMHVVLCMNMYAHEHHI